MIYNNMTLAALYAALPGATDEQQVIIQEHIDYRLALDAYGDAYKAAAAAGPGTLPPLPTPLRFAMFSGLQYPFA